MRAKINSAHYVATLWHALLLGAKISKDNFTFTPNYTGILILLNSEYWILLCEVNTINDRARENKTWPPLENS